MSVLGAECLLVHVGKRLPGERRLLLMPLGLPALADHLCRRGVPARVVNLPLEQLAEPRARAADFAGRELALAGVTLHWHQQAREARETAAAIKAARPGVKVVLGGFTASAYHRELLREWPSVDFVIRGDAERPLLELALALRRGGGEEELSRVPNLTRRRDGAVVAAPLSYRAGPADLDELRYSRFDVIHNKERALRGRWGLREDDAAALSSGPLWFYYNPGRGCAWACSFCGGGAAAQSALTGRGVVWKSPQSALQDLRGAWDAGARRWYACFDPEPSRRRWLELLERLEREGPRFLTTFECWGLPTPRFVEAFRRACAAGSTLAISVESGSEAVRRLNKGPHFTNAALRRALRLLREHGVRAELYFTANLPGEDAAEFARTEDLIRELRREFDFTLSAHPLEAEPLSPMSARPQEYGVSAPRRTLDDLVAAGAVDEPGYALAGAREEEAASRVGRLRAL